MKIDRHRNKVQDHSFTDKYLTGRTRPGDYAARHAEPSKGLDGEEKERRKDDNGEDIQEMRVFIADLPLALPPEEHREVATKDQVYQRLMEAGKQGRKPTDRELLSRGERSVIPEGQHKKDGGHGEKVMLSISCRHVCSCMFS